MPAEKNSFNALKFSLYSNFIITFFINFWKFLWFREFNKRNPLI
jgi:hypothetical protein